MRKDVVLVTNNPCFQQSIDLSRLQLLRGTSLDVLITVRDAVHLGNFLLTHPLYGNLRPNQQPFRSVLLRKPAQKKIDFAAADDLESISSHLDSISKIEEAVLLYQSYGDRLPAAEKLPEAVRGDYSFVDAELMRESLTLYGLLPKGRVYSISQNHAQNLDA